MVGVHLRASARPWGTGWAGRVELEPGFVRHEVGRKCLWEEEQGLGCVQGGSGPQLKAREQGRVSVTFLPL